MIKLIDKLSLSLLTDSSDNGQEGEYCMIKAMTTASYLYQANQIKVRYLTFTRCVHREGVTVECRLYSLHHLNDNPPS